MFEPSSVVNGSFSAIRSSIFPDNFKCKTELSCNLKVLLPKSPTIDPIKAKKKKIDTIEKSILAIKNPNADANTILKKSFMIL